MKTRPGLKPINDPSQEPEIAWESLHDPKINNYISEKEFKEEYEGTFDPFESANALKNWKKLYHAPFRYNKEGTTIWDAGNNMVLNIRGWGRISSQIIDEKIAGEIQDAFGNRLAELITEWYNKSE